MMRNMFYGFDGFSPHMSWGGGLFMMIGGVILLGLLIFVIVSLTRNRQPNQPTTSNDAHQHDIGSALNILHERYARGEINEEEYARKKTELRK